MHLLHDKFSVQVQLFLHKFSMQMQLILDKFSLQVQLILDKFSMQMHLLHDKFSMQMQLILDKFSLQMQLLHHKFYEVQRLFLHLSPDENNENEQLVDFLVYTLRCIQFCFEKVRSTFQNEFHGDNTKHISHLDILRKQLDNL